MVAHNIPTRQFPDWYVTVVTSPVTHLEDTTELQPAEGTVTECLNLLFRVAACTPKPAEVSSRYSSCKKCPWLLPHSKGSNLPSPVPLALTHDACSQGRQRGRDRQSVHSCTRPADPGRDNQPFVQSQRMYKPRRLPENVFKSITTCPGFRYTAHGFRDEHPI